METEYTVRTIFVTDHGRFLVDESWTTDKEKEVSYLLAADFKPIGNNKYEYRYPDTDELRKVLVEIE